MSKTFHLRPWGRISAFLTVTADSDADALLKVKREAYAGREEAFPSEWEIHAARAPAEGTMARRPVILDPALPPPEWVAPATPIAFDQTGTEGHPVARLTDAITGILQKFGPMSAEEVGMALVVYGFGPLLDGLDAPPSRSKRQRRRRPKGSPRWRQKRLPGIT